MCHAGSILARDAGFPAGPTGFVSAELAARLLARTHGLVAGFAQGLIPALPPTGPTANAALARRPDHGRVVVLHAQPMPDHRPRKERRDVQHHHAVLEDAHAA